MAEGTALATEYVEIVAKGLDDATAAFTKLESKMQASTKAADNLEKALNSGAYANFAKKNVVAEERMAALQKRAMQVENAFKAPMDVGIKDLVATGGQAEGMMASLAGRLGPLGAGLAKLGPYGLAAAAALALTVGAAALAAAAVMKFITTFQQGQAVLAKFQVGMDGLWTGLVNRVGRAMQPIWDGLSSGLQRLEDVFARLIAKFEPLITFLAQGFGVILVDALNKVVLALELIMATLDAIQNLPPWLQALLSPTGAVLNAAGLLGKPGDKAGKEYNAKGRGFEDVRESYKAITMAAQQDKQEIMPELTREVIANLGEINSNLGRLAPAVR